MLNALIYFSENVTNLSKTKYYKLLNYLDFTHFRQTGRSVTGLEYFAYPRGPLPKALSEEWDNPQQDFNQHLQTTTKTFPNSDKISHILEPQKKFEDSIFTPFELKIMEDLAQKYFAHTAEEMSNDSHFKTGPWHEIWEVRNQKYGHMPYDLVLERQMTREDKEVMKIAKERRELIQNYQ